MSEPLNLDRLSVLPVGPRGLSVFASAAQPTLNWPTDAAPDESIRDSGQDSHSLPNRKRLELLQAHITRQLSLDNP